MSQDMMDPEIISDFIIEAKEHLETIEPNLLELEKSPDNLSLLNEIFRPMHSLKGASGFLNLNRMNRLAHKAENILDELRKATMLVDTETMDIILSATDALRQMIDNLESFGSEGDVDTDPIIERLDALLSTVTGGPESNGGSSSPAEPAKAEEASPSTEDSEGSRIIGDIDLWIDSRAQIEPYSLTAFGEGHLRDFMEEARENTSNLTEALLELERSPDNDELINDLFRLFHNLKGNSGIIGFHELNSLTHEAETLLNSVRKHEYTVTAKLVDLLLLVVDVLEALIVRINSSDTKVTPFDTTELLEKLQQAVAGGKIELPASLMATAPEESSDPQEKGKLADSSPSGSSNGDINVFLDTIKQQMEIIVTAIVGMRQDGQNKEYSDAMFRSLTTIQNACGFMGFDEGKIYAQRTAGIVDKGRSTQLDFSIMANLLEQECSILHDLIAGFIHQREEDLNKATDEASDNDSNSKEPKKETPSEVKKNNDVPEAAAPKAPPAAPKAPPAAPKAPAAAGKPPAGKPGGKEDSGAKSSSTIRVDHEKLDHLMNLIGELIINRNRYSMLARQLEVIEHVDEVSRIAQDLSETTYAMARISDDLQATIMKVRMVPVASVFSRFPRLVRDLARKSNKEIELTMEGEDTELDKSVVEVIGDPLVHLIRNSVDHGIELEEDRAKAGKQAKGNVWLRAFYKGNSVSIEIEDDGKGIDPEKMRQVAIRKGILSVEDAKLLDDRESMELIFAPGFSSAEVITDISGRGVGMDVVRTNIKSLKGSIGITSEVGKGTKFTLSLPLTLAIIDALMVNVAGATFAIPLDAVSETTKIEANRLTDMKGRKAVTLRGEVLGIVSLSEVLGLPSKMDEQEILSVVVIQDNERRLGVVVDSLLERQEIVIKPLGSYLGDIQGISGATIMGDGSVILILDPHEIYVLATSKS